MKKRISLLLAVTVIASLFAVFPLPAAAASDTLTITSRGTVLGTVEVGSEFIFRVNMSTAGYRIYSGQAEVRYNSDYVQVVEHGTVNSSGSVNMNAYSFPARVRNAGLFANYLDTKNLISYNFSKITGVTAFDINEPYFKIRFKAIAPGTVEIRHYATIFTTYVNNKDVRLFYFDKGNDQLDPIPYMVSSIEPAAALIGDADGDGKVEIMDATFIQYLVAGRNRSYKVKNADVTGDDLVDLQDALTILRYKANLISDSRIGEWIFTSEQEAS